jgi:hypothetical protein
VPVDRAEPSDTPRPRDEPPEPDGPPPAQAIRLNPADRDATHRAYRAQVDQTYAVHRDGGTTWAEAQPVLRAAWERHQDQHAERTQAMPQTHPDNSWSSGDARRLTPSQNAEASRACAEIHDEGERSVLPTMLRVEAADPERRLAGLEHMLKGTDRLKEKVADQLAYHADLSPHRLAADVPDAVRFTFEYSKAHYTDGVQADVQRIRDEGFELMKLKNLWSEDQYKGVNSQWRRPETGLRFEVQFHTQESREAKELTHEAYERLRDPLTSESEATALEQYQRRVNALISVPSDVFAIEDYPPEKRDG